MAGSITRALNVQGTLLITQSRPAIRSLTNGLRGKAGAGAGLVLAGPMSNVIDCGLHLAGAATANGIARQRIHTRATAERETARTQKHVLIRFLDERRLKVWSR
jgi:hypothetical protein